MSASIPPMYSCRSCGSAKADLVLDLGLQPLANNYPFATDASGMEPRFPLQLVVCTECWLMQVADTLPPELMFSEYAYFSSYSDTMLTHAAKAVDYYTQRFGLDKDSFVVEVASNDGYLLKNFVAAGIPCLGVDPAENVAKVAQQVGVETEITYFGLDAAKRIKGTRRPASLILGNNVFAHVPQINDFIAGLKELLAPGGAVALEFPHGCRLISDGEFDTIYHEHVFYFTLTALEPAFRRHGLEIISVEELPIHGGSLRILATHVGEERVEDSVAAMLRSEEQKGVKSPAYYQSLKIHAQKIRDDLGRLLTRLAVEGKSVAAYGASAKGCTMLNYCGITKEHIRFVADRSVFKQGRLTPGSRIPIVATGHLAELQPDYCLLLVWNFAEEIFQQQQAYRHAGGRFIIPIPAVQVL
jgi:SAM-dependent methyltransferase